MCQIDRTTLIINIINDIKNERVILSKMLQRLRVVGTLIDFTPCTRENADTVSCFQSSHWFSDSHCTSAQALSGMFMPGQVLPAWSNVYTAHTESGASLWGAGSATLRSGRGWVFRGGGPSRAARESCSLQRRRRRGPGCVLAGRASHSQPPEPAAPM